MKPSKESKKKEFIDCLAKSRYFKDYPKKSLFELIKISTIREYGTNRKILKKDYSNDIIYFLIDGKVRIEDEGEEIVTLKRRGDVVGEMSVISGEVCMADAIAYANSKFLCIKPREIDKSTPTQKNS
jgi:CRP-like cAMP-binding protein